jgi:ATP-dependent DNA helicase RecG
VDLVVGTHALIQEHLEFNKLGLVVVDEQHRFGVEQRLALGRKGTRPDVLIMTATPIPRSLALAYLSDMDVSVIDEMPPGREPVRTEALPRARWKEAYRAALEELEQGYRVFVVLPLLERSEELGLSGARHACEKLQNGLFADYECCLLHGRMSTDRKRAVMERFRTGDCRVMVATTVVEVGIDVPEATVMIVQHAERLGLAQLHQLRGRVGRGDRRGLCYLLASPETEDAERRMEVLTETTDGFKIAEEDLRLRGPGKFFGTEQSGMPDFRFCDFSDTKLLKAARQDALELVGADPELRGHPRLRDEAYRRYGKGFVFAGVG